MIIKESHAVVHKSGRLQRHCYIHAKATNNFFHLSCDTFRVIQGRNECFPISSYKLSWGQLCIDESGTDCPNALEAAL